MRHAQDPRETDAKGILRPALGMDRFALHREPAPLALAPYVERLWTVRWSLPDGETFEQETLPHPCVHLVFEEGQFRVHGPGTRRFKATLRAAGWVTGVKFTSAGFFPFATGPLRSLVDRVALASELFTRPLPAPPSCPANAARALCEFLLAIEPAHDPMIATVNELVRAAQQDGAIVRVDRLASLAGISERSLHRLFEKYVGVSSKWIVRRARVQGAAERVARGESVDWAAVAAELGYSDQAHLIRDFRAQIGVTPAAYARACVVSSPAQ
ncbi:MAG: helix-turn-helix transcriptional regulator [Polyangiales bacterium]